MVPAVQKEISKCLMWKVPVYDALCGKGPFCLWVFVHSIWLLIQAWCEFAPYVGFKVCKIPEETFLMGLL